MTDIDTLEAELAEAKAERWAAVAAASKLRGQLATMTKKYVDMRTSRRSFREKLHDAEAELAEGHRHARQMGKQYGAMERRLQSARTAREAARAESIEWERAFSRAEQERDAAHAVIAQAALVADGPWPFSAARRVDALRDSLSSVDTSALAARDRRVAAEAVRDAAIAMRRHKDPGHWNLRDEEFPADAAQSPDVWLERRADRIENGETGA